MGRLEKVLDKADELGMVVIVGYFYFGQEPRMKDEATVVAGVKNATEWLTGKGHTNVLVEIANECDIQYKHEVLEPKRVGELMKVVRESSAGKVKNGAKQLYVSVSMSGGKVPSAEVVEASDFVLLHGNGVKDPKKIPAMVEATRKLKGFAAKPIVFNEDDHFGFEKPENNFLAATAAHASWGYFDFRMKDEGFAEGYQSMPADWGISSARKKGFFELLKKMSGE